jgi:hypothetical protein
LNFYSDPHIYPSFITIKRHVTCTVLGNSDWTMLYETIEQLETIDDLIPIVPAAPAMVGKNYSQISRYNKQYVGENWIIM